MALRAEADGCSETRERSGSCLGASLCGPQWEGFLGCFRAPAPAPGLCPALGLFLQVRSTCSGQGGVWPRQNELRKVFLQLSRLRECGGVTVKEDILFSPLKW